MVVNICVSLCKPRELTPTDLDVNGFVDLFGIMVETCQNRARIVRNRCVPVCGYHAGYSGLGLAQLWAQTRPEIEDFRPGP